MAELSNVTDFVNICNSIANLESNKERYFKRSEWGEVTFELMVEDIETVFWFVTQAKKPPCSHHSKFNCCNCDTTINEY